MPQLTLRNVQIAALGAALLLAGCGVKGPLEPPPGVTAAAPVQTAIVTPDTPGPSVSGTQTQTSSSTPRSFTPPMEQAKKKKKRLKQGNVPVTSAPEKPDVPFILDSLL